MNTTVLTSKTTQGLGTLLSSYMADRTTLTVYMYGTSTTNSFSLRTIIDPTTGEEVVETNTESRHSVRNVAHREIPMIRVHNGTYVAAPACIDYVLDFIANIESCAIRCKVHTRDNRGNIVHIGTSPLIDLTTAARRLAEPEGVSALYETGHGRIGFPSETGNLEFAVSSSPRESSGVYEDGNPVHNFLRRIHRIQWISDPPHSLRIENTPANTSGYATNIQYPDASSSAVVDSAAPLIPSIVARIASRNQRIASPNRDTGGDD